MKTPMLLRTKFKNHTALTLLELLTVIAILAVLAVLLFPTLSRMNQRMKTTKCAANIRVYGTAILTLVADKGSLPYWDGMGSASTETGQPQFNKWLTEGGYLSTNPRVRCPLADGSRYDDVNGRYRFPYAGNMSLCEYFPNFQHGMPVPLHRVVLAGEMNDWDGFENRKSFNSAIWRGGEPGMEGDVRSGRMPIARYHGSPEQRGLHFFFLDGSVQLVFPTDNDWTKEPICAPLTGVAHTGYFYHLTHFSNMKKGTLTAP